MAQVRTFKIIHKDGTSTEAQLCERESPKGRVAYYNGDFYAVLNRYPHPVIQLSDPVTL